MLYFLIYAPSKYIIISHSALLPPIVYAKSLLRSVGIRENTNRRKKSNLFAVSLLSFSSSIFKKGVMKNKQKYAEKYQYTL